MIILRSVGIPTFVLNAKELATGNAKSEKIIKRADRHAL